jgi:hypothetical protein
MWMAALKFDLAAGYRFWTAARLPIIGAIRDEARLWRRGGSGEGRLDRWLYTHPTASPEQVLRAQQRLVKRPVFHSLQEAAEGIKQFWSWGGDPEFVYDEETTEAAAGSFRSMYDCFDPYQLSYSYSDSDGMAAPAESRLSYLNIHKRLSLVVDRLSGGLDTGPDVGKPTPCEFCESARGRSHSHNVALPSLSPRRVVGRRPAAVDIRPQNPRTKPRAAETGIQIGNKI